MRKKTPKMTTPTERELRSANSFLKDKVERLERRVAHRTSFEDAQDRRREEFRQREAKWQLRLLTAHILNGMISRGQESPHGADAITLAIRTARNILALTEE